MRFPIEITWSSLAGIDGVAGVRFANGNLDPLVKLAGLLATTPTGLGVVYFRIPIASISHHSPLALAIADVA